MRRIKSAPANIAQMAHNTKQKALMTSQTAEILHIEKNEVQNTKIDVTKIQDISLEEFSSSLTNYCSITDPTEQLFFSCILRFLLNSENRSIQTIFQQLIINLITSYLSHKIMQMVIIVSHTMPTAVTVS